MAAKSDGVRMKKSDVAFTPLQNSEHSGSVHVLPPSLRTADPDLANGGSGASAHPDRKHQPMWECLWILAAMLVYVADVGTDVWLAADYYVQRDYWWFGLTLVFVVLGSFCVQLFSFRWFLHDLAPEDQAPDPLDALLGGEVSPHHPHQRQASTASRTTNTTTTTTPKTPPASLSVCVCAGQALLHILHLGLMWRYLTAIYLGVRSRQSGETQRWRYHWRMIYQFADVSMLHLLATFLESAPQLVLQLCIVIQTQELLAVQGMTAGASLVSLAWALSSYQKALRESRDDKKSMGYLAVVVQFCWHFFTIAARVVTFALFASVFQLYFGIFIVLHWCVMTFWIVHCETHFCVSKWEEIVFDMVVGIIYIFSWFNVKEGRTRCRLFIYYSVILGENAALSALCRQRLDPDAAAHFSALPSEGAADSLRSNPGTAATTLERDAKHSERDGCVPVFQVRRAVPSTTLSRAPRLEETVIKIDLCRNRYPAWERHVLDRGIRKAILAIDCSVTPRLQYKDDALVQERLEYETTL
ncbi:XK-related protein 4 isoform X2 [Entelurus aequoreus]|uniref:XK-related protein 4 isoform X2 n=1 Tax=Entelurus aequoreus TaxID=161455 RepID=UPI002B1D69D4|nr:XK-related protein 4 isoform X2 [Entelurus aequoreus]